LTLGELSVEIQSERSKIVAHSSTLHTIARQLSTAKVLTTQLASTISRKTAQSCATWELFSYVSHTQSLLFFSILDPHDIGKKFLSLPARQCKCVLCGSFSTIHPLSKVFSSEMRREKQRWDMRRGETTKQPGRTTTTFYFCINPMCATEIPSLMRGGICVRAQ
jgi:hypothetical protein